MFDLDILLEIELLEHSDQVIQTMTEDEILTWLREEDIDLIKKYLKRYEKQEFWRECIIIRDFLTQ